MSYIKIHEGGEVEYPFSPDSLRGSPTHSFPSGDIPVEILAEHGVFPVSPTEKPVAALGFFVEESTPSNIGGVWVQQWTSRPASSAELAAFKDLRRHKVLKTLARKIEAVALSTAFDKDDLDIIESMTKLSAATVAYMLAASSTSYRTNVAACRTNARSLLQAISQAPDFAAVEAVDITSGWPV